MKHFLRRSGDVATLKSRMLWLPQWHQARALARELGVSDEKVTERLAAEGAIGSHAELSLLYRMIIEALGTRNSHEA